MYPLQEARDRPARGPDQDRRRDPWNASDRLLRAFLVKPAAAFAASRVDMTNARFQAADLVAVNSHQAQVHTSNFYRAIARVVRTSRSAMAELPRRAIARTMLTSRDWGRPDGRQSVAPVPAPTWPLSPTADAPWPA